MDRGYIYWYKFKLPDKQRPVVILDQKDGMKNLCAVNLDHIQTISKARLGTYIKKL